MNTKKLLLKIITITLIGFVLNTSIANAQSSTSSSQDDTIRNSKDTLTLLCDRTTAKINELTNKYDTNKDRHIKKYNNIKDRLKKIDEQLKQKNFDTTKIETDYIKLDSMIKDFAEEYSLFIVALNESKNLRCGESEGAYKAKLAEARTHLTSARNKSTEIRNFISNNIKPDLKELKNQKPN